MNRESIVGIGCNDAGILKQVSVPGIECNVGKLINVGLIGAELVGVRGKDE